METILKVNELSKSFGRLQALDKVSFEIQKGKVYGILGPNGSGKSTTLGIVLNVVNKSGGSFEWFENSMSHHDALKKVGAIIERPNFYPYMTAKQNLELVCKIKESDPSQIEDILSQVNLLDRKDSKFRTFSLGMKQRLAIASALINNPEFLILDEPTNGLDPQGIHEIREIIKNICSRGTTVLLASHLLDEVEKICSDVIIIQKGKILYRGPVSDMTKLRGTFKLQAKEQKTLTEYLEKQNYASNLRTENGLVNFDNLEAIEPADLNKELFEQGIILTHLELKGPSLEEQFLSLTNS